MAHTQPCSCLARAGPGPTQLHGCKQLHGCVWAIWAPGALDHWPYGPQGPWAQPLFDCVAVPSGGFFSAKKASKQKEERISKKIGVCFKIFAILANADLNSRLKICKIAI